MNTPYLPLISIIVPIYQAELYISSCIESIQKQSYSHFELLLIDDGSSDNSGSICQQYAKGDSRIKYFKKENQGVSHTRNFGIQIASGEYIVFIDSDDMIKIDFLEKLFQHVEGLSPNSLSLCKFSLLTNSGISPKKEDIPSFLKEDLSSYNRYLNDLITRKIHGSCSRVFFPMSIIRKHNIRFTPCKIAEDQLFLLEVLTYCDQVVVCDEPLYIYRQDQTSSSHNIYIKNYLEDRYIFIKKLKQILSTCSLNQENYEWLMAYSFQFYRMLLYMNATASEKAKEELKEIDHSAFSLSVKIPKRYQKGFAHELSRKHQILDFLIKHRLFFFAKLIRSWKRNL